MVKTTERNFRYKNTNVTGLFNIRLNTTDKLIIQEVWAGSYFIHFDLVPGEVVVDIGGHIGAFSILAAKLGASVVEVYEPFIDSYSLLTSNIALNQLEDKIIPHNDAITKDSGSITLIMQDPDKCTADLDDALPEIQYAKSFNSGHIGLHISDIPLNKQKKVEATSIAVAPELDRLIEKYKTIGLIKIDCEGAEVDILPALTPERLQHTNRFAIEWHRHKFTSQTNKDICYQLRNHFMHNNFNVALKGHTSLLGMLYAWR